jgi:hypothetical protein
MHNVTQFHAPDSRLHHLVEELFASCDSDFDTAYEDLEREFQGFRLQLASFK